MRKTLVIFALVSVIAVSIIAGTLAMYTTTIDNLATGSVVAKEFILLESGTDTFTENVKIAPAETVSWQFAVKNYDDTIVTETSMDLDITIDVTNASGKTAIEPLQITVKDEDNNVVGTATGTGEITFDDDFLLDPLGQSHTYTVLINWPSDDSVDINYAGADYGTALKVTVTGTQQA